MVFKTGVFPKTGRMVFKTGALDWAKRSRRKFSLRLIARRDWKQVLPVARGRATTVKASHLMSPLWRQFRVLTLNVNDRIFHRQRQLDAVVRDRASGSHGRLEVRFVRGRMLKRLTVCLYALTAMCQPSWSEAAEHLHPLP